MYVFASCKLWHIPFLFHFKFEVVAVPNLYTNISYFMVIKLPSLTGDIGIWT